MYIPPIIVPKKNTKNIQYTTKTEQRIYAKSETNNSDAECLIILIVIAAVIMFALTIKENSTRT